MTKVYIIWGVNAEGASDVTGVYADEKMAKEMAAYCDGAVYEFELNTYYAKYKEGYRPWFVCLFKGGKVARIIEDPNMWNRASDGGSFRERSWRKKTQEGWDVWVLAKDRDHAIELAKEITKHG